MRNYQLVSIVMCVFNGNKYLSQQIDSILSQSYDNFELLILDDHSTDSSVDIISYYSNTDSRIRLIKQPRNLGFNKNFEYGLQQAKGEFIAISDQDDIWLPHKISKLVNNIKDATLIYSNSQHIDEYNSLLPQKLDNNINHIDEPKFTSFLDENFVTGHTCIFRRELLGYILPFPEDIYFYDWWIGFAASYVGRIKYLDEVLTHYRIHPNSLIQLGLVNAKQKRSERLLKKKAQIKAFSNSNFLNKKDAKFIEKYLSVMFPSNTGFLNKLFSFLFVLKNSRQIYPWYKKNYIKKLNFLRKRCSQ